MKGEPAKWIRGHQRKLGGPDYREDLETGCWVWLKLRDRYGYPMLNDKGVRNLRGHRVYYERHVGPIPDGAHLHHACHNPACVNPDHLKPLTVRAHARTRRSNKLSLDVAREIRSRAAAGERGVDLASAYGVRTGDITLILQGKRWAEDEPAAEAA